MKGRAVFASAASARRFVRQCNEALLPANLYVRGGYIKSPAGKGWNVVWEILNLKDKNCGQA